MRALAAKSVNRMTLKTVRMPQKGICTSPYSQRVRCRRLRAFPKEGISGWNRSCRFFTKGGGTQPRSGSSDAGSLKRQASFDSDDRDVRGKPYIRATRPIPSSHPRRPPKRA